MTVWPLRFRPTGTDQLFFSDEAGAYFVSNIAFLERYAMDRLDQHDEAFLRNGGHLFDEPGDPAHTAFAYRFAARQHAPGKISYLILVPTLRCNLTCDYCQVSRAPEKSVGFDWSADCLEKALRFLDRLETDEIKLEFQGGEPLLRVDLLETVRSHCRSRFSRSEFVICTNLQTLGPDQLAFLESDDTFISTSIDGGFSDHDRHRTQDPKRAEQFFANLETIISKFGSRRLAALPTIDIHRPPNFQNLVDTYERLGLRSIYLRPINYQGFARRSPLLGDELTRWNALYSAFLDSLIERNFRTQTVVEEFYFSHCLKRLLRPGVDGHVDLRNPSVLGTGYLVIDYDGRLYPTDEARMLSRIGHVDLSIGTVADGVDSTRVAAMSGSGLNNFDPDCIHCPYQPFCGSDPIDDISRYHRIDIPRPNTWFCGRQLAIFDRIVESIYSRDEKVLFSLRSWAGLETWPAELAPVHP